jgi:hypothetical protein
MKIRVTRFLKTAVLFGASFCLASLPLSSQAESVIKETFEAPLAPTDWKIDPKGAANAAEGVLTLNSAGPANQYAVVTVKSATPSEKLNFVKNAVEINLTDLAMKGTASPDNQIFQLILGSDSDGDQPASKVAVRITAAGGLIFAIQDKGASSFLAQYFGSVVLPIKNLKLALSATGAVLSIDDANGKSEKEFPFASAPTLWANSAPYIRLHAQRNPGDGEMQVTLHGFSVDSTPAIPEAAAATPAKK